MILAKNTYLQTIPVISPTYSVKFEILPRQFKKGLGNIIHLTTGTNCCGYGTEIPVAFFNSKDTEDTTCGMTFCSAVSASHGHEGKTPCWITDPIFHRGYWTTVEMMQYWSSKFKRYFFAVKVDNQLIHRQVNNDTRVYRNVHVYASDPWNNAAQGIIRNLVITTGNISFFQTIHSLIEKNIGDSLSRYKTASSKSGDLLPFACFTRL